MNKDQWVEAFETALIELRPHLAHSALQGRLARTVGLQQYTAQQGVDPRTAAQRYHAATPRPKGSAAS